MTGLRWNITVDEAAGTGLHLYNWAIVFLEESQLIDTMDQADTASFYRPEQDVLTFGGGSINGEPKSRTESGSTKSMRKMKVGDRLAFIAVGVATNTVNFRGVVQFFCKT